MNTESNWLVRHDTFNCGVARLKFNSKYSTNKIFRKGETKNVSVNQNAMHFFKIKNDRIRHVTQR